MKWFRTQRGVKSFTFSRDMTREELEETSRRMDEVFAKMDDTFRALDRVFEGSGG